MTGKEFAKWMDDNAIDIAAAAAKFGVGEATIYNWRSTVGVPRRVRAWIADYESSGKASGIREPRESRPGFFEIFRTDEELHRADRASRLAGAKSLAVWCHDIILAETNRALTAEQTESRDTPNPVALVSEPGNDYTATDATGIERLPTPRKEETA